MKRAWMALGAGLMVLAPEMAWAQASQSDQLAEQWRAARKKELAAQRAALDAEMAALDKGATPDTPVAAPTPAPTPAAVAGPKAPPVQTAPATATTPLDKTQAEQLAKAIAKEQEDKATQKFGGIEFGIGMSFTIDTGGHDRVSQAALSNGIVRVTDEDNGRARVMLESHYFFTPHGDVINLHNSKPENGKQDTRQWGIGPFIALQPGTDNVIEAIGAGIMWGFRRASDTSQSFNLGFGVVIDPNTRVLGDGIVADQPLPAGETEVRYKEQMQTGLLILASFSF